MRITDWPSGCRPRERIVADGADTLSDAELLAVFLRTGVAGKSAVDLSHQMLGRFGSLRELCKAPLEEVAALPGMGPAKYAALQAAIELGRRVHHQELRLSDVLESPEAVASFLKASLRDANRETFAVLFLDVRNRMLHFEEMFRGTLTHTTVHPREIVRAALACNAANVILAHNHPSGDVRPSPADHRLTATLKEALALVDVKVLDHFIIANGCAWSFAKNGLL